MRALSRAATPVRRDAQRTPGAHQRPPHGRGEVPGNADLVSPFAGVSGAADDAGGLRLVGRDGGFRQPVVGHFRKVGRDDLLQDLARIRPLEGEEGEFRRPVADVRIEALGVLQDPAMVLVGPGDVDDPEEPVFRQAEADQIVDDVAAFIAHDGVEGLAHVEAGGVVRDQPVYQRRRVRTADFDLAHVGHVAQADPFPDGPVLLGVARVLDGAGEALEVDHASRRRHVDVEQRRFLHGFPPGVSIGAVASRGSQRGSFSLP